MTKTEIWQHFNRMQKACMEPERIITKRDFFAESESEQKRYYNWMFQQVGPFTAGPYWY